MISFERGSHPSVFVCPTGGVNSPKVRDGDVRIFVALFSYEPATMSPNPDAAEEELPFSEGQIIKVRPRKSTSPAWPC